MAQKATVLVIDDEESMRDSCSQALQREGYEVKVAEDGRAGLQKVKDLSPDVVLLDLKMPGMNGMEVLEKIRGIDPAITTIVITGYATIDSAVEAMRRGAYDFLPKPFTPETLRLIVARGVSRKQLIAKAARLEDEKRKTQENLISLVSHELRAPLVDVQQYLEAAQTRFSSTEDKVIVLRVGERVRDLLDMIAHWLDLASIKESDLMKEARPLRLSALLADVVASAQPLSVRRDVTVKIEDRSEGAMVRGDEEALRVAFTNLVANAIKFNRDSGTVTVLLTTEDDRVHVDVTDTGIGIPEESLPFIFDQFYRVRNRDTRHITGSGLGLSIAKRIIEAHGGTITAASHPGTGSTFTVVLPSLKQRDGGAS